MVFNGYSFLVWAAIPPLRNINLIQIRLAVHKPGNETPQPLKSSLIHDIALEILTAFTGSHSAKLTGTGMLIA